ncbi:MAG: hypothetical protein K5872_04000 [Rhizobiaceae bacterium]|nr:hypothetical protein [Rhizobiaceae bacterium]
MAGRGEVLTVNLIGPMTIIGPDGRDCTPKGRKSCALVAMLAVAPDGRRGRRWLQSHLWSDRGDRQGAASLRQALLEIRNSFGPWRDAIRSDALVAALDLKRVALDIESESTRSPPSEIREFLEGLDIRDPEFEDWVRDQRSYWSAYFEQMATTVPRNGAHSPDAGPMVADTALARGADRTKPSSASPSYSPAFGRFLNDRISVEGLRRRTAIAVVPLLNFTGVAEQDYIAEGFSESLLDRLSCLRWLPIIARSSTFGFRQPSRDLIAIADQVGARYVVDGELFLEAGEMAVRVGLTNAETGLSMLSRRYGLARTEISSAIHDVLTEIVATLDFQIDLAEQQRAGTVESHLNAFDEHLWRGRWHVNKLTRRDSDIALQHFQAALDISPDAPEALIQLAWCQLWRLWVTRGSQAEIEEVKKIARRALTGDSSDARAFALVGTADMWLRRADDSIRSLRKAIELNPSFAFAHRQLGTTLYLCGRPSEAVGPLQTGTRLSPNDQHLFVNFGELGMVSLMLGDPKGAIDYAAHSLMLRPAYWYAHLVKINGWKEIGDVAQHGRALEAYAAVGGSPTDRHFDWLPFVEAHWPAKLRAGMQPLGRAKPFQAA